MNLGFIGTGIMGRPMASHLQKAGHQLSLLAHLRPPPEELLQGGAIACDTAAAVSRRSEYVFLMLPNTPDVEHVLFGPQGVADGLRPGSGVIDMSSIDPLATRAFAERIEGLGGFYVDAPVSGGEIGARNASLTIMAGGDRGAFERVKPLLALLGRNITRVGEAGMGQVAKVANQMVVASNLVAVAEALLFSAKAGADPARVREALMGGFAASRVLEVHGERMINRSFDPGFRVRLHQKDLALGLDSARALGLSLPATAMAQQLFSACTAHGGGDWDHSAVVRALELLAGHNLDGGRPDKAVTENVL